MKLISMTDFVTNYTETGCAVSQIKKMSNYAEFLKQPLKLEMFVPCDEDGNKLQEPEEFKEWMKSDHYFNASENVTHQCRMYKKAKEKVLFDGFDIYSNGDLHNAFVTFESSRLEIMNVENLITDFQYSFYLTPNAIKRIFG